VETNVEPNIHVFRRGVIIGSTTKLGSGIGGVLIGRNPSQSSTLPTATTKVASIPQMVFTNPIMTIHVNRIVDQPLMISMVAGGGVEVKMLCIQEEDTKNQLL